MSSRAWIAIVVTAACGSPAKHGDTGPVKPSSPGTAPDDGLIEAVASRPPDEVRSNPDHVTLPAIPVFELPAVAPGYHSVRELFVRGAALRDTEVKLHGYVTWVYDCATDVGRPGESKKTVQKRIAADPTICQRPKFYLGDTATTPREQSLWVVDVPRPPNQLEKKNLPKEQIDTWPAVPKVAVGDEVTVVGTFALRSSHAESNSDGLLIYASLSHDVLAGTKSVPPPPPPSTVQAAALAPTPPPQRIAVADRDAASALSMQCADASMQGDYDRAIELCKQALKTWPGDHSDWWIVGVMSGVKKQWTDAIADFTHAVELDPGAATYEMWLGVALYEQAKAEARAATAAKRGANPEEVEPDMTSVDLDPALSRLLLAVQLEPRLARAQYYIGRIYRAHEDAPGAAAAFSAMIAADPNIAEGYLGLIELYARWGYLDQAIAVGEAGTGMVADSNERANVYVAIGKAHDARADHDQAIVAFEAAVKAAPQNGVAQFQLGQAWFRKGDYAKAKPALEEFVKSQAAEADALAKGVADKMLLEISAAKGSARGAKAHH